MYFTRQKYIGFLVLMSYLWFVAPPAATGQTRTSNLKNQSIEQKLTLVNEALTAGDLIRCEKILQEVLSIAPRNVTAQTLAGIVADRKNDLPKAERHFAAAARLTPQSPEARNNYGAILLRLNRRTEAAKEFTASLAANANQSSALVNLAQIRFAEDDLKAARQLFEKAQAIQPDFEIARALLIISLRLKEAEKAKNDFQNYFLLAQSSTEFPARGELGAMLLESGLTSEAIQELEAAKALNLSDVNILVTLSRAYLQQKNVQAAGKLLESAIVRGITDAKIYLALSEVYQSGGYLENAIPAMRLAIEKDPANELYRARYGLLLIDSKAPAAAIIRLNESLKIFPRSARIWLTLGIAQLADGKTSEAKTSFENSLTNEPKSVPALAYLATISVEQADYARAVSIYERALAIEEKNAYLHFLLADTLAKIPTGDAAAIEKHLRRAVEIDKTLAQAHLSLGKLNVRSSRWLEAAAEFEQAVKYEPELTEGYYQLGRVLTRLKRSEEAQIAFDKHKKLTETQSLKKENDRREYVRRLANVRF